MQHWLWIGPQLPMAPVFYLVSNFAWYCRIEMSYLHNTHSSLDRYIVHSCIHAMHSTYLCRFNDPLSRMELHVTIASCEWTEYFETIVIASVHSNTHSRSLCLYCRVITRHVEYKYRFIPLPLHLKVDMVRLIRKNCQFIVAVQLDWYHFYSTFIVYVINRWIISHSSRHVPPGFVIHRMQNTGNNAKRTQFALSVFVMNQYSKVKIQNTVTTTYFHRAFSTLSGIKSGIILVLVYQPG